MFTVQVASVSAAFSVLGMFFAQSVIQNDSYFYGQSPPIYPTPQGSGLDGWAAAYAKASKFVCQLTIEEKVNLTAGAASKSGCSGNIPPISRLGFPGMCLQDAGNGVRGTDFVNGYPSGIHVGASWNKNLTYQRALYMGGEFRAKGANVAIGPFVGALGRIAEGGRNWEGFTNDPYLCGSLAGETVRGIQSTGVITSTKHYIGNEQELDRNPATNSENQTVESVSSNVDDKTLHELYLWPFADAVRAGTGNIMCSYNRVNNSYGCQNSKTLNGILKGELGYQGWVVSDWFAHHSGAASALAGLDMAMPDAGVFWGDNLTESVMNGSVPESRVMDMATRILASWYQMGQDSADYPAPGVGIPADLLAPHQAVNAKNPASRETLLQGAIEGHVLVKNINDALPLKNPQLISLFGYDAHAPNTNTPAAGLSGWALGFLSADPNTAICGFIGGQCPPFQPIASNGTITSGGGSGASTPAYISAPFDALKQQAIQDGTSMFWDFTNVNATGSVADASDACLVFINAFASEGVDRPSLRDDYSDALVTNIAAQCNNTIVVIHNAGIRLVDQWIENPNVTAVIFAHLPGQDSGRALIEILYGRSAPSGKLPYTVAMNESQYGALLSPHVEPNGSRFALFPQDTFSEGVYIDYRAFDAKKMTPRYEFGFGLSYTTFSYSNLAIKLLCKASTSIYPTGPVVPGGAADLWDVIATVTADVTNTGSLDGAEVAQLYIGIPGKGQPVRQLRGFDKVDIAPGQTVMVNFNLLRRDLSVWDVGAQQWALHKGKYRVEVGASSRNLPLQGSLRIV